jgi:hypothetical protein
MLAHLGPTASPNIFSFAVTHAQLKWSFTPDNKAPMEISIGNQLFQLAGAMLILAAYVAHQLKWMSPSNAWYNILNAIGSGILGYYAIWPRFQAGFVVLEVMWVVVSIYALFRSTRKQQQTDSAQA